MIRLGATITLVLFVLQLIGVVSLSAVVILAPLFVGIVASVLFWFVVILLGALFG